MENSQLDNLTKQAEDTYKMLNILSEVCTELDCTPWEVRSKVIELNKTGNQLITLDDLSNLKEKVAAAQSSCQDASYNCDEIRSLAQSSEEYINYADDDCDRALEVIRDLSQKIEEAEEVVEENSESEEDDSENSKEATSDGAMQEAQTTNA